MDNPFVTTQWLAEHMADPKVIILDGTWHMPATGRDPHAEYRAGHIPGAVFFDIDGIADTTTDLPHMLPSPNDFGRMVGALGIGDDMTVVIYDEHGLQTAPRVWWTFKTMGARDVRILEGGGPKWRAEKRAIEVGEAARKPASFHAHFDARRVVDFETVRGRSRDKAVQIADARSAERFAGTAPEPRPGLRGGHIPNSLNVPVGLLTAEGKLKPIEELKALFAERGVDLGKPIITSCGSGVTASTLALALELSGASQVAVYDGSWTEWGGRKDAEIE